LVSAAPVSAHRPLTLIDQPDLITGVRFDFGCQVIFLVVGKLAVTSSDGLDQLVGFLESLLFVQVSNFCSPIGLLLLKWDLLVQVLPPEGLGQPGPMPTASPNNSDFQGV
jgi:hypothetical protein